LLALFGLGTALAAEVSIPHERYVLDNGLTVVLHEDHSLPQVVVNIWYEVGAKDERPGRTGFAHLFEHLMFMGTSRLPGSGFDDLMEAHGGWNNAWTSEDATDYYDAGPAELLPTLLWMEADRMDGLAGAMTAEKVDKQRDVVRNERRQSYEDSPYGVMWLALPRVLFPEGHPYAHTVIGSHEDLEAAGLDDVVSFFQTWYTPDNASLVIAGDFESAAVKPLVAQLFGALPRGPGVERIEAPPVDRPQVPLTELQDDVQTPRSWMFWHSPPALQDGDAEHDLIAEIMGGGRASRLYQRLVVEEGLATDVGCSQWSQLLGSVFAVSLTPAEGVELSAIEAIAQEELERLAAEGPTDDELARARNGYQYGFLEQLESLHARASMLNRYLSLTGESDHVAADLARYQNADSAAISRHASRLSADRRAIVRVLPEPEEQ
jgi:predicted Zn-dependent peptidase